VGLLLGNLFLLFGNLVFAGFSKLHIAAKVVINAIYDCNTTNEYNVE